MAAPLLPMSHAGSVLDQPLTVDQSVGVTGFIGRPVTGSFTVDRNGISNGSIFWDAWSTSNKGFKLTVKTDRTPAMVDAAKDISIPDLRQSVGGWTVASGGRAFGFSAKGSQAMSHYEQGTKWRGFAGTNSIEAARRRSSAVGNTTTEIKLRTQMKSSLPSGAKPKALVIGTVTVNL